MTVFNPEVTCRFGSHRRLDCRLSIGGNRRTATETREGQVWGDWPEPVIAGGSEDLRDPA